jgi:serine/threonine-protein kinase HipA
MTDSIQEIEVCFTSTPEESLSVGVLAIQERQVYFEYSPGWLQKKLELSPFTLPLKPGLLEHKQQKFGPLFGLFDDSLPDGWGLLLMDRYFRNLGRDPASLTSLDRLLYLGRCTMGALTYHPPTSRSLVDNAILNLHELASLSQQILAGDEMEILPLLLRAGGSPGGARPKVLVGYNSQNRAIIVGDDILPTGYDPWIIKFSAQEDTRDGGPVEYAYSRMASAAGITMPKTRLFVTDQGDSFFGVRRFDRGPGNHRYHIHTFGNLIQTNFRIPGCDYSDLLKVTSLLTHNRSDLLAAYRLMLFNVLTHNRDDHAKNFSFILDDTTGQWSLSPAYDLTFSSGPGGEHSMTIAGEGRAPTYNHFVKLAIQYDISTKEMESMIAEVADVRECWPEFAQAAGVSEAGIKAISKHFQGFAGDRP